LFSAITVSGQPFEQVIRTGALHERLLANVQSGVMAGMSMAEVKVYHALCVHADWVTCLAYPGVELLKDETGLVRSSVYSALADLQHRSNVIVKRSRSYRRRNGSTGWGSAYEVVVAPGGKVRRAGKSAGADIRKKSDSADFREKSFSVDEKVRGGGPESPKASGPELCIVNPPSEHMNVFSEVRAEKNPAGAAVPPHTTDAVTIASYTPEQQASMKTLVLSMLPEDLRGFLSRYDPIHPVLRGLLERYLRDGKL
jgi:hypothetical protein